jgi:hypothetical protein
VLASANVEVKQEYRAIWLVGRDVLNEQNEAVGTIAEFVIGQDCSLFAVLDVGGFPGLDAHLVAVSIRALALEGAGHKVVLPGRRSRHCGIFPNSGFRADFALPTLPDKSLKKIDRRQGRGQGRALPMMQAVQPEERPSCHTSRASHELTPMPSPGLTSGTRLIEPVHAKRIVRRIAGGRPRR